MISSEVETLVSCSNLKGVILYPFLFDLVMSSGRFFMRKLGTVGSDQTLAEAAILKRTFAAQVHTLIVFLQKEIRDLQAEWDIPTLHELWVQMQCLEKLASAVQDWPVRNLTPGQKGIAKQLENEFKRAWPQSPGLDQKNFRFYKAVDNLLWKP